MHEQDIKEDWDRWLIEGGVSKEVRVKLFKLGYVALYYLHDAAYGTTMLADLQKQKERHGPRRTSIADRK